jgi:hypothetical protein
MVRKEMPAELVGLRPAGSYSFDELYRLAQVCHASGMFKDTADAAQAMMKIVRGQEMGLPPTTAMSAFDIVKDRLFVKPWAIAAKINACGYGSYRVTEQTDERCTIQFARRYAGQGWIDCPPVSYTYAEAKAHGLVDRSPHWKASPAHMLYQRAMGRGGAMYFPELLAGLELPPDTTPIPEDRHRKNIVDLFGREPDEETPPTRAKDITPQQKPRQESNRENAAWDTLTAHQADPRLPEEVLDRIGAALSPLAPASDGEAFTLAGEILDWLNHAETQG